MGLLALAPGPCTVQAQPTPAVARAPRTAADVEALSRALGGRTEAELAAAVDALSSLSGADLPALEARVRELARRYPTGDAGYDALRAFGEAAGVGEMSEGRDVLGGVPRVLATAPSDVRRRVAERLCLLRSLERIGTQPALRLAYELLASDMKAFRWEARHLVRRVGRPFTPWLLRGAAHPLADVDLWAGWGLTSLGITDPGRAVQDQSPETLAEILVSYATVKHMGAMSVVVSYLGDDREVVRTAAREAMTRYAENGTWQLRLAYEGQLGRAPRPSATWRELLRELTTALDARRDEPVRAEVQRAVEAAGRGALSEAVVIADGILVAHPASASVAPLSSVYGRAAAAAMAASKPAEAGRHFRRAAALASTPGERETHRASAERAEAFALAHRGIPVPVLSEAREEIAATETNTEALALRARRTWSLRLGLLGFLLFAFPMLVAMLHRMRTEARDRGLDREAAERLRSAVVVTRDLAVKAGGAAREAAPSLEDVRATLPSLDSLKSRLPAAPSLGPLVERLPRSPTAASIRASLPSLDLSGLRLRAAALVMPTRAADEVVASRRAERESAARAELAAAVAALRAAEAGAIEPAPESDLATIVDEPASRTHEGTSRQAPTEPARPLPRAAPKPVSLADAILGASTPEGAVGRADASKDTGSGCADARPPVTPALAKPSDASPAVRRHARPTRKASLPADLVLGAAPAASRKKQSGA